MSVFYEPKKENVKEGDDEYIIRLQTEQSEEKRRARSKYSKIRPYNRASKLAKNIWFSILFLVVCSPINIATNIQLLNIILSI